MTKLSIIIPVLNEETSVDYLIERVVNSLDLITHDYEIIFINDGSTDLTSKRITEAKVINPRIRLVNLVRNYGHMEAISTGLKVSHGEYVLSMDGDLQHPPECIPEMFNLISNNGNIDVVQAVRSDRNADSFFKKLSASLFYRISARITGVQVIPHAADFRIMNRATADVINSLPEGSKILRFLIPELGFNVTKFEFACEERHSGKSKYSFGRMVAFAFDSVISFSTKPLRMMSIIGFALAGIFLCGTIVTFTIWLVAKTVPGWTSIFLVLLTSNALILASLGLLGEYVSKIRQATLGRPNSRWTE